MVAGVPRGLAGIAPLAVLICHIAFAITNYYWLEITAIVLAVFFSVLATGRVKLVGNIFLGICLVLVILLLIFKGDSGAVMLTGMERAVVYCSFFTAVATMRHVVESSPLLLAAGQYVASQKAGLRYLALMLGSHLFGLAMNFGGLAVLSTMVERAIIVPSGDPALSEGAEALRRDLHLAALRGFAATATWSPLSVTPLVVATLVPGTTWGEIVGLGIFSAAGLMLLSYLVHLVETRNVSRPPTPNTGAPRGWRGARPLVGLTGIVTAIFACVILLVTLTGLSVAEAVMIVAPTASLLWTLLRARGSVRLQCESFGRLARVTIPDQSTEIVILMASGFIGIACTALLPTEVVADRISHLPALPVLITLIPFFSVIALGLVGINPIISVAIMAAILPSPELVGVPPILMAVVFLVSWSLCAQLSPYTASTLTLGSVARVSSNRIVFVWNRLYGMISVSLVAFLIAIAGAVTHS